LRSRQPWLNLFSLDLNPVHSKLEDWKNGWFGVELGISPDEIDRLIELLQMLRKEPDQHFHLSSDYKDSGGLGDITLYVQSRDEPSNMITFGKAIAPNRGLDDKPV
jgi:hypothetical protein